jgi:sec-independent protein translocase protein TatB
MLSPADTAIVFVLALLLFGPEQLPKLARQLGEAMRHIQSTTNTFMMEMERAADAAEPYVHDPLPLEAPHVSDEVPVASDEITAVSHEAPAALDAEVKPPVQAP